MSQKNKSINEKMQELSELVAWFDGQDFSVEEALDKFKQAESLATEIENDLNSLKNEVNIIKQKFDGEK